MTNILPHIQDLYQNNNFAQIIEDCDDIPPQDWRDLQASNPRDYVRLIDLNILAYKAMIDGGTLSEPETTAYYQEMDDLLEDGIAALDNIEAANNTEQWLIYSQQREYTLNRAKLYKDVFQDFDAAAIIFRSADNTQEKYRALEFTFKWHDIDTAANIYNLTNIDLREKKSFHDARRFLNSIKEKVFEDIQAIQDPITKIETIYKLFDDRPLAAEISSNKYRKLCILRLNAYEDMAKQHDDRNLKDKYIQHFQDLFEFVTQHENPLKRDTTSLLLRQANVASIYISDLGYDNLRQDKALADTLMYIQDFEKNTHSKMMFMQNAAEIYRATGYYNESIEAYVRSISCTTNTHQQSVAHNIVATIYDRDLGNPQQALKHLAAALKLEKNPITFTRCAALYNKIGDTAKAIEYFETAARLDPSFVQKTIHFKAIANACREATLMPNYARADALTQLISVIDDSDSIIEMKIAAQLHPEHFAGITNETLQIAGLCDNDGAPNQNFVPKVAEAFIEIIQNRQATH